MKTHDLINVKMLIKNIIAHSIAECGRREALVLSTEQLGDALFDVNSYNSSEKLMIRTINLVEVLSGRVLVSTKNPYSRLEFYARHRLNV